MDVNELAQAFGAALEHSATVQQLAADLALLRRGMSAGGRPWSLGDGCNLDGAGAGTIQIPGPAAGQLLKVEAIDVSVTGASAAAIVAAYIGSVDERNLIGFLAALAGNNPSRGEIAPAIPKYAWGGVPILVRITGAVAAGQATARFQGRLEEIAEISGDLAGIGRPVAPVTVGQS